MLPFCLFAVLAGLVSTGLSGANATMIRTLAQPLITGLIVQGLTIVVLLVIAPFYTSLRLPGAGNFTALD